MTETIGTAPRRDVAQLLREEMERGITSFVDSLSGHSILANTQNDGSLSLGVINIGGAGDYEILLSRKPTSL